MKTLTRPQAIAAMEAAVAERGADYRHGACSNVAHEFDADTDETVTLPGCLVGTALHIVGVSLDDLDAFDGSIDSGTAPALRRHEILDVKRTALLTLKIAQVAQDTGRTWGEALRLAQNPRDAETIQMLQSAGAAEADGSILLYEEK